MPSPYRTFELVSPHALDRDMRAIVTTADASHGVLCRPGYADGANFLCPNHIAHTNEFWSNAVQQLLTVKRVFEAAFDDEATYLDALDATLQLFEWVFCTCPMHGGGNHNTHEDWTKLCRVVSCGFVRGLRGDDLFNALLCSMDWKEAEVIPDGHARCWCIFMAWTI